MCMPRLSAVVCPRSIRSVEICRPSPAPAFRRFTHAGVAVKKKYPRGATSTPEFERDRDQIRPAPFMWSNLSRHVHLCKISRFMRVRLCPTIVSTAGLSFHIVTILCDLAWNYNSSCAIPLTSHGPFLSASPQISKHAREDGVDS